jgi:hypothetical protein
MESKIILEIQLQNSKLREQLEAITNDIKKQQAEMKELVKQNKQYAETTEYKKKAAAVDGMKNTQKNLTAAIKEQNAEEKRLKQTQAALDKQRQSSLAAIAKEEAKQRELIRAATMEAKSEEDLIKKKNALIAIRKRVDQSTEEGRKAYERMGQQINKLNDQLKNSDKAIGNHQRNVGNYPKDMGAAGSSVSKFSASMVAAYAAIAMAAKQVYAAVKDVIVEFLQADKVQQLVNQSFGKYSSIITEQANAFEKATGIEAEQFMRLSISAKAYGSANEDVAKSINLSLGLAKEFELQGVDSETALKALVKAQNGQYAGLEKIYPALKNVADESEKMRIVNELAAQGWEKLNAYTATYSGQIDLVNHAVGNLKEESGKQILEGILGKPEEIGKATSAVDKITEALEKTGVIAKYLGMMREQAKMMLEPFLNLFKIFGEGGSAIDGLSVAVKVWMFIMQAVSAPVKLLWSYLAALTGVVLDVTNAFKGKGEIKSFQDGLNIINKAIVTLLSPISDLVGMSDEVSKFFGVARDECTLTTEEYEKLNKMLFNTMDAFKEYKAEVDAAAEEQAEMTAGLEELTAAEEAEKKAKEDLIKKNEDFVKSLKAINDEYEYQMYFAKTTTQEEKALQEKLQKTFDAYKQFFADGGYTGDELRKLQELQEEMYNFTDEIKTLVNNPELKLNIIPDKEEIEKATTEAMMLWQKASNEQEKARQQDIDEEKKAYEQKLKEAANFSGTLTEILASSLTDQGLDLKEYAKKTSLFLLDVLEKQVIAQVTATALAQPDSVATFGLTGAARAGIMIGLVKGGFSLAKALISNVAFAEKGTLLSGNRHSRGGIMVNAEDGEAIINRNSVAQYKPILSAINQAGGGVPFMEQGGIAGFGNTATATSNTNIFDGVEIVATIEDINAGLVRESKRMKIARI